MGDVAHEVLALARATARPYAVFVQRRVELMPADGPLFARRQRDPARMAHCVGVFDGSAKEADVEAALAASGGAA